MTEPPDSVAYYEAPDGSIVEVIRRFWEDDGRYGLSVGVNQTWTDGNVYQGDYVMDSLSQIEHRARRTGPGDYPLGSIESKAAATRYGRPSQARSRNSDPREDYSHWRRPERSVACAAPNRVGRQRYRRRVAHGRVYPDRLQRPSWPEAS